MNESKLCPVKWQIESTGPDGYYGYAWGGGLPEAVRTDVAETTEAALASLRIAIKKLGRCPDVTLCNERTEEGRKLAAVLA